MGRARGRGSESAAFRGRISVRQSRLRLESATVFETASLPLR
jgi:hypothetical protein